MSGIFFIGLEVINVLLTQCPPPVNTTFDPFEYQNFPLPFSSIMPSRFNITVIGKTTKKGKLVFDLQSPMKQTLIQLQMYEAHLMVFLDEIEAQRFPLPFSLNDTINIQLLNDGSQIHVNYKSRADQPRFTWLASFEHYHRCSLTGYKFLNITGPFRVELARIYECDPKKVW